MFYCLGPVFVRASGQFEATRQNRVSQIITVTQKQQQKLFSDAWPFSKGVQIAHWTMLARHRLAQWWVIYWLLVCTDQVLSHFESTFLFCGASSAFFFFFVRRGLNYVHLFFSLSRKTQEIKMNSAPHQAAMFFFLCFFSVWLFWHSGDWTRGVLLRVPSGMTCRRVSAAHFRRVECWGRGLRRSRKKKRSLRVSLKKEDTSTRGFRSLWFVGTKN